MKTNIPLVDIPNALRSEPISCNRSILVPVETALMIAEELDILARYRKADIDWDEIRRDRDDLRNMLEEIAATIQQELEAQDADV